MTFFQNVLLTIGAICLGLVSGFFFVVTFVGIMASAGQEPSSTGFGQYVGGLVCGAPLGVIVGLAGSLIWISAREETSIWSLVVWLGVLPGSIAGIAAGFHFQLYTGFQWYGIAAAGIAGATVGGSLAYWMQKMFLGVSNGGT